jgi:Bacterial Ig-like domain/Cohesin domain
MSIQALCRLGLLLVCVSFVLGASPALAATLSMSPATGVYSVGGTFTVSVTVNTSGAAINAADGTLSFNPRELQVVSVSRASSIFNLWTTEPTFSNGAGTVSFSGGSPTGYTGNGGTVLLITFRTLSAGSPKVTMSSGSVLAADGRGTNVLTSMGSGAYTISAVETSPTPEVIVEYVAPANTPAAPKITSETHGDQTGWSKEKTAKLNWSIPNDVIAVRTLLDESPGSIPTKVYDSPIKNITVDDLSDGVSYFHIQFKNEEGWGKVTHYRLAVDATAPTGLTVVLPTDANLANPTQKLIASTTDSAGSPIALYKVQVNGGEVFEVQNEKNLGEIVLKDLKPGRQSVMIEAYDAAGNVAVTSFTFDVESFDAPRFTDIPAVVNSGVVPVFVGTTRPNSAVTITLTSAGVQPLTFTSQSDETGSFRFIPDGKLLDGVYHLTALASDEFGAQSLQSEEVSFVVQPFGLVRIGSYLVSLLSVLMPLIALVVLSVLLLFYVVARFKRLRSRVKVESSEVVAALHQQFSRIRSVLQEHENTLIETRKTKKLTVAESSLMTDIHTVIDEAEQIVDKEATDVARLIGK